MTRFGIAEAIAMKPSQARFLKPGLLIAAAILASPGYASGQHEGGGCVVPITSKASSEGDSMSMTRPLPSLMRPSG